uniref:Odorant binding protein 5 n=1 Tax=Tomicus yunnanensis TaxID=768153 RepID=A0A4P2HMH4_9CUCU|nr:odorant binding protein 5 [Tomicus yunnanensis]
MYSLVKWFVLLILCSHIIELLLHNSISQQTLEANHRLKRDEVAVKCMQDLHIKNLHLVLANGSFSVDDETKEFLACVGRHDGSFDKEGNFVTEAIKKHLQDLANSSKSNDFDWDVLFKSCLIKHESFRETVYKMTKCLYEANVLGNFGSAAD